MHSMVINFVIDDEGLGCAKTDIRFDIEDSSGRFQCRGPYKVSQIGSVSKIQQCTEQPIIAGSK